MTILDRNDRPMNDPTLFDPDRTTTAQCPVCGATREPDQDNAPECAVDRDREQHPRRPTGCLNTYDPATAPFPEGY